MKSIRILALASMSLLAASMGACGQPDAQGVEVSTSLQDGEVSHIIRGVFMTQPYADPASGLPYPVKVADMSATAFGTDLATFGPFPTGYPLPADPKACIWQRGWYDEAAGRNRVDCLCLVAAVDPSWGTRFNVAPQPGGTGPVNLAIGWPGSPGRVYAACWDRPDRGFIIKGGKVVNLGG